MEQIHEIIFKTGFLRLTVLHTRYNNIMNTTAMSSVITVMIGSIIAIFTIVIEYILVINQLSTRGERRATPFTEIMKVAMFFTQMVLDFYGI